MRPVFREQKVSGDNQESDENQFGFGKRALAVIAFMLMLMLMFVRHIFRPCKYVGQRLTPCRYSLDLYRRMVRRPFDCPRDSVRGVVRRHVEIIPVTDRVIDLHYI